MTILCDAIDPGAAVELLGVPEDFPDRRLFIRACKIVNALADHLRMPPLKAHRAEQRGLERWLHNRRLSEMSMLERVLGATAASCADEPLLILASDTSEIDEHGRGVPADAGPLRSSAARGYLMHQVVAARLNGPALGAVEALAWTRPWKLRHQDHATRPMKKKESRKWDDAIEHTDSRLRAVGFKGKAIFTEDREGDIYEHLVHQKVAGRALVVRYDESGARFVLKDPKEFGQARRGQKGKWIPLRERLDATAFTSTNVLTVDGRVRDRAKGLTHQLRQATVSIRYCDVVLSPSKKYKGKDYGRGLPVWIVEAKELAPPETVEPLHWILISLEPVLSPEDAQFTLQVYKTRWKVEDFTKVAKSGCQLESQHVRDLTAFKRLMAVVLATANQLLNIVTAAREAPERAAADVVEPAVLLNIRETAEYHRIPWPGRRPSVAELLLTVAQIGGYEKRAGRQPGWLVLQRGWARIAEYAAVIAHHEAHRDVRRLRRKRLH